MDTENAQAKCVIISGAVGSKCVNGAYEPTSERHEGRVRYRMIGDEGKWIEHMSGDWFVKPAANKGESMGWASVKGGCALEACGSRTWKVVNEGTYQEESGVKMEFMDKVFIPVLPLMFTKINFCFAEEIGPRKHFSTSCAHQWRMWTECDAFERNV